MLLNPFRHPYKERVISLDCLIEKRTKAHHENYADYDERMR